VTPRERFLAALDRKPLNGRVPNFELVFFLTMEAFGKVHPSQRIYSQWDQMEEKERELHRREIASIYVETAERYEHNAILLHPNPWREDEIFRLIDLVREIGRDRYALLLHGDTTLGIPSGSEMEALCERLVDEPGKVKAEAEQKIVRWLAWGEDLKEHGGLDGFALCSDYCFNTGPFLSPAMFSEFVTPYLAKLTKGYRDMGFHVIKHTDGNIMPILDDLVQTNPHALHSLDPQGGVDIAEVKRRVGDRVCLIGNVSCAALDTGTDAEVIASARYALKHGMPGGGYVFGTSNCVYTGMRLARYELMLDVWRREGNYPS
jgi:uroporphyrinogen decarboxylase